MVSILKTCCKCKQEKPISEFYKDKRSKAGITARCKSCKCEAQRSVSRDWYWKKMGGKRGRPNYDADNRREYYRKLQVTNPNKLRAVGRVHKAVKRGKMKPANEFPCARCGNPASQYHHYLGYDPEHHLDVEPLCTPCHGLERRKS